MTSTKTPWGNPATSSFQKTYIRQIDFEGATAEVHREILDIAVEVLHLAHEQGKLPTGHIDSFVKDGEGAAAYGTRLRLVGVEGVEQWGFAFDEEHGDIVFGASIEAAKELTLMAQEAFVARQMPEDTMPAEEEKWAHIRPGQRPLSIGSRGQDVQFLQVLLSASDHGGVFDEATAAAVCRFQAKLNAEQTGVFGEAEWRFVFPKHEGTYSMSRGDGGFKVRVAQAALAVYADEDIAVTGMYGIETDKAVRRVQVEKGLRINGNIRIPEWVALLGPRDSWPIL